MHKLFGKLVLLEALIPYPQIDPIIKQLAIALTDLDRLQAIEDFLIQRLNSRANQLQIIVAVEIIWKYAGNLKINLLTQQISISQSQLEKRFRKVVGASPKKFASIVRFRNVLNIAHNERSMTHLGLEAGYFDQAHFIKDFKSFTGLTPERFFKIKQKATIFYNHRF